MEQCKHFKIFEWGEPPLEPDENGTIEREEQCKKRKGYNVVCCGGDTDMCELSQTEKLLHD